VASALASRPRRAAALLEALYDKGLLNRQGFARSRVRFEVAEQRGAFWKEYSRFMGSSPDFRGSASPHASHCRRLLAYFQQLYFPRAMPHVPVNEKTGFSLIRASPVLDCKTATADVGKRVAAKEH